MKGFKFAGICAGIKKMVEKTWDLYIVRNRRQRRLYLQGTR